MCKQNLFSKLNELFELESLGDRYKNNNYNEYHHRFHVP